MLNLFSVSCLVVSLLGCPPVSTKSADNLGVATNESIDSQNKRKGRSLSVEHGASLTQSASADMLHYTLDGRSDSPRTIEYLIEAATRGNAVAQWRLGYAFESGSGTRQSFIEAYAWYRCAIATIEATPEKSMTAEAEIAAEAKMSLRRLLEKMPDEQFVSAEQLAKQYISAYSKRKLRE